MKRPTLRPGRNIAMKIPPHEFEATLAFYRDVLGLPEFEAVGSDAGFDFDGKHLWLDKVDALSQAEIWLEIVADDMEAAAAWFDVQDIARRDEIEPLPEGYAGFWIANPAGIIHLISGTDME